MPDSKSPSCRVLIVEDDYFIADELLHDLTAAGIEVAAVASGEQSARDALEAQPVDVVLLDINLSGEASFGLARELRARGTPFVFVTGYDRDTLPAELRATPLLTKPHDSRELVEAILARAGA